MKKSTLALAFAAAAALSAANIGMFANEQAPIPPVNDVVNPYNMISDYFKLPEGRKWGSTSTIDVDKDGTSIWVAERCGGNSCLDTATGQIQNIPTVMKFDTTGKLVTSFGNGLLVFPHGMHVDRDGNVWVTDGQDNAPRPARGAAPAVAPTGPPPAPQPQRANAAATKGQQVWKFAPDGKVLLTLGKPGGGNEPDYFFAPNDVITSPDGKFIFVSEGHSSTPGQNSRLLKFDATGKFIKSWGKWGSGDGEFDQPHALAFDSKGLLYVGDRNNNRVQVFDQDGNFKEKFYQFSRPSGIYIDKNDNLYVADSESGSVSQNHQDWKRGIRIGSLKDKKVTAFIPDPESRIRPAFTGTSAAEGVVVDSKGVIYGAEVGPRRVSRYVKK
ncbi:MAG: peptidyl-alpha-hydroxyglycine alpha-amidating lyase family protein [Vicinamibacterales bacterium]